MKRWFTISLLQANVAKQPPPETINESELDSFIEEMISSNQQSVVTITCSNREELARIAIEGTGQDCSQLSAEMEELIQTTLDALVEDGALDAGSTEELKQKHAEQQAVVVRDFAALKEQQLQRLRDRMVGKREDRNKRLRRKQEIERRNVRLCK